MAKKESASSTASTATASASSSTSPTAANGIASETRSSVPTASTWPSSSSAGEYFSLGSQLRCTLCTGAIVEGEVMAFEPATRILILKCSSSSRRNALNDVHLLNLNMVSDVAIFSESNNGTLSTSSSAASLSSEPPSLQINKLNTRTQTQIERKKRLVKAFKNGISPEGQKLFQAIAKTIDEIDWSGENIVVMKKVTITPPYKPENVRGVLDSRAFIHTKKLVEKHMEDARRLQEASTAGTASNAAAPVAAAASAPVAAAGSGSSRNSPVGRTSSN